jgi:energy-converting hydrogenase Eha subunit C
MTASITVGGASIDLAHDDTALARATVARVSLRLLPFLFVLYLFNFLDRTNVSIAALQMNRDLRFSAAAHSDRTKERFMHAARGSAVLTLGFVGVALLPWPLAKVFAIALVPIGAMMFLAPYWCLPPMLFRGTAMAASIALINSIQSLGGFVGPNIIGIAKTLTGGTTGAFLVLASFGVLAGAGLLVLRRHTVFRTPSSIGPVITPTFAGAHSGHA